MTDLADYVHEKTRGDNGVILSLTTSLQHKMPLLTCRLRRHVSDTSLRKSTTVSS